MQDWAFYPHTNGSVLAAGIFLDDVDEENGCATILSSQYLPLQTFMQYLPLHGVAWVANDLTVGLWRI
jgi:hypothetical protein